MTLLEQFLREKKDHIISKLQTLTPTQKTTLIDFFKKYPNYEKEIDWNRKDLTYSDFKPLISKQKTSRSSVKTTAKIKPSIVFKTKLKSQDYHVLYEDENYLLVMPLNHGAAVFMNSHNCLGSGATWCIGTTDQPMRWYQYVFEGNEFAMLYSKPNNTKYMLQLERYPDDNLIIWSSGDTQLANDPIETALSQVGNADDWPASLQEIICESMLKPDTETFWFNKVLKREEKEVSDNIAWLISDVSDDESFEGYEIEDIFQIVVQQDEERYGFFDYSEDCFQIEKLQQMIVRKAKKFMRQKYLDWKKRSGE